MVLYTVTICLAIPMVFTFFFIFMSGRNSHSHSVLLYYSVEWVCQKVRDLTSIYIWLVSIGIWGRKSEKVQQIQSCTFQKTWNAKSPIFIMYLLSTIISFLDHLIYVVPGPLLNWSHCE
jgi:hypothetical protein